MKLSILIILIQFIGYSQNGFQSDLCTCIEEKHKTIKDSEKLSFECTNIAIKQNIEEIKNKLKDNLNETAITKLAYNTLEELSSECDYYKENIFPELMNKYKFKPTLKGVECKDFYKGKFYFFNDEKTKLDTVFVNIKKNKVFSYSKNGKYNSEYRINWVNNCEFFNSLVKTNDPKILSFKKEFEKQKSEIINITKNHIEIQTYFYNKPYQYKIYKIE